uniref:Uncharacterized protein n=1 Tax=Cacopsylla melanoneura TaxID=428564 RepID=A0A8D8VXF0_9HEMI
MMANNTDGKSSEPSISDIMVAVNNLSSQVADFRLSVEENQKRSDERNEKLEKTVRSHTESFKRIYKQDISRNLIVYGWKDLCSEPHFKKRKDMIVDLLKRKLEIQDLRPYDIHNVKFVGQAKNVVIVTLCSPDLVHVCLQKARNLKGTGIYLDKDLSPEDRKIKQSLLGHKKLLSGQGRKVSFKNFKTLLVDDKPLSLEELEVLNPAAAGNKAGAGGSSFVPSTDLSSAGGDKGGSPYVIPPSAALSMEWRSEENPRKRPLSVLESSVQQLEKKVGLAAPKLNALNFPLLNSPSKET